MTFSDMWFCKYISKSMSKATFDANSERINKVRSTMQLNDAGRAFVLSLVVAGRCCRVNISAHKYMRICTIQTSHVTYIFDERINRTGNC